MQADREKPYKLLKYMVPGARLELARPLGQRILSPQRLPIPPPGPGMGRNYRLLLIRSANGGIAIYVVATRIFPDSSFRETANRALPETKVRKLLRGSCRKADKPG